MKDRAGGHALEKTGSIFFAAIGDAPDGFGVIAPLLEV